MNFSFQSSILCLAAFCQVLIQNVNTQLLQSAIIVAQDADLAYGVANGFRSCGGQGTLIQWSAEACHTAHSTCQYPIDGLRRSAKITFFMSSKNEEQSNMLVEVALEDSSVEAGQTYTLITSGAVSEGNIGIKSTAQVILYRLADQVIEMCAEADFEII